jgi:hypothetical protein
LVVDDRIRPVLLQNNSMQSEETTMKSNLLLCGSLIGTVLLIGAPATSSATLLSSAALTGAADELRVDAQVARRGGAVAVRRGAVVRPGGAVAVRRGAVVRPGGAVAVRRAVVVRPVRPWARRAYYGTIIGGVALGTLIAATAVPAAPAPNLCWYWADPTNTQGYWDYCRPPR